MEDKLKIEEKINIENMIYEIRGKQVMLDSDLAKLYHVETKRINEAVKNNPDKFPERFSCFLTNDEFNYLRSKISASSLKNNYGGRRYNPRVFTEQGVAMLATILKSKIAVKVSIQIMDAFVLMRRYISSNLLEQKYINNQVMKNTEDIKLLKESFSKFEEKKKINEIYFNGQIYDAYSKLIDIMQEVEHELIIIDSYADKIVLDMICKVNKRTILITKKNNLLKQIDIDKYNKQYHNLRILYNDTFHDRYLILDNKKIYHCGTSLNHAGSRTFSINVLEDKIVKQSLLETINRIVYK